MCEQQYIIEYLHPVFGDKITRAFTSIDAIRSELHKFQNLIPDNALDRKSIETYIIALEEGLTLIA